MRTYNLRIEGFKTKKDAVVCRDALHFSLLRDTRQQIVIEEVNQ